MSLGPIANLNGGEIKDAAARRRIEALENYATPQMFGAKADGVTDDTAAIQTALAENKNVVVPAGEYAIYGTINVNATNCLILQNGVKLIKPVAAGNGDPVIHITGQYASVLGSGMTNSRIQSQVATPYGVLLIGDKGMEATPTNTLYCTVCDIGIVGHASGGNTSGDPSRGVYICCADGYNMACFFNTLQNLYIQGANDGLMLEGNANANIIENIQFYQVGNNQSLNGAAIHLKETNDKNPLENVITNAFHHKSESATTVFLDGTVLFNFIQNIACEQGGTASKGIKIVDAEAKCQGNDISIIDNTSGGNIIPDMFLQRNTFRRRGNIATGTMQTIRNKRIKGNLSTLEDSMELTGVSDGTNVKLFTVACSTLRHTSVIVDLELWFSAPHLTKGYWGGYGTAKYLITANASGNEYYATMLNAESRLGMVLEPIVSGSNVTFAVKFPKVTGTTTNNIIHCDYKITGRRNTFTVTEHTTLTTVSEAVAVSARSTQTTENGTTTTRPASPLKGQMYFDTTIAKPIWYNGTKWVDATGTAV